VVRVLDSGQLHQSERSWVRFLDGPIKIARPQDSHVVTWPASDQIIIIIIIFLLLLFIFIIIIIIIFIIIILVECYFAAVVCCSVMGVMWFCFCVRSM